MTHDEIQRVAATVLRASLSRVNFGESEVAEILDQDGDPSLLITARLRPGGTPIDGDTALDALTSLRSELQARGEERFPYLRYVVEGQEPAVDAADFAAVDAE